MIHETTIERYTLAAFPCSHSECCGACELKSFGDINGHWVRYPEHIAAFRQARAEALEEAAKLFDGPVWAYDYREIAARIRALAATT